ncbi:unnamed protein product [Ectocarpus sp. 6 AP-2014]
MECWRIHPRIRYYFGLTIIGTAVNLAVGISGTVYVVGGSEKPFLFVLSWTARHVHIALDTIVLYGILGAPARQMDENGGSSSSIASSLERDPETRKLPSSAVGRSLTD